MYFLYKILRKNNFYVDHYFARTPSTPTCQRMKMYGMAEKREKDGFEIIQLASVTFFNDVCVIKTDKGNEHLIKYPKNINEAIEIFNNFKLKRKIK